MSHSLCYLAARTVAIKVASSLESVILSVSQTKFSSSFEVFRSVSRFGSEPVSFLRSLSVFQSDACLKLGLSANIPTPVLNFISTALELVSRPAHFSLSCFVWNAGSVTLDDDNCLPLSIRRQAMQRLFAGTHTLDIRSGEESARFIKLASKSAAAPFIVRLSLVHCHPTESLSLWARFPKLERLELYGSSIDPAYVRHIVTSLPDLHILELRFRGGDSPAVLTAVVESHPNSLEKLVIHPFILHVDPLIPLLKAWEGRTTLRSIHFTDDISWADLTTIFPNLSYHDDPVPSKTALANQNRVSHASHIQLIDCGVGQLQQLAEAIPDFRSGKIDFRDLSLHTPADLSMFANIKTLVLTGSFPFTPLAVKKLPPQLKKLTFYEIPDLEPPFGSLFVDWLALHCMALVHFAVHDPIPLTPNEFTQLMAALPNLKKLTLEPQWTGLGDENLTLTLSHPNLESFDPDLIPNAPEGPTVQLIPGYLPRCTHWRFVAPFQCPDQPPALPSLTRLDFTVRPETLESFVHLVPKLGVYPCLSILTVTHSQLHESRDPIGFSAARFSLPRLQKLTLNEVQIDQDTFSMILKSCPFLHTFVFKSRACSTLQEKTQNENKEQKQKTQEKNARKTRKNNDESTASNRELKTKKRNCLVRF